MSTIRRGIKNAFRNTLRTGSIVIILSLSIGLVIAMLAARQAVSDRIAFVKSSVGNTISISPAGFRGGEGGGEALTTDLLAKATSTAHVTTVVSSLSDRLTSTETTLVSSIEPGSLGNRRAENSGVDFRAPPESTNRQNSSGNGQATRTFTMPVQITGVSSTASASIFGSNSLTWKNGQAFDAEKDANNAAIGSGLATKNNLTVGSTFTAYGATLTVVGIYDAGNTFANNSVYVPLATLQRLSAQPGAVTAATASIDSSDNLAAATAALKTVFGDKADISNSQDAADATVKPLESVSRIALFSLIGALVAGAVIILLTMVMIVRERRREIGVMKAIGASNFTIMRQFVAEAITLTALGLVVGTGLGIAASTPITEALVTNSSASATQNTRPGGFGPGVRRFGTASQQAIRNIEASVGWQTLLLSLGAALVIAIVGSAVPSLLISNIKPAEAMRSE